MILLLWPFSPRFRCRFDDNWRGIVAVTQQLVGSRHITTAEQQATVALLRHDSRATEPDPSNPVELCGYSLFAFLYSVESFPQYWITFLPRDALQRDRMSSARPSVCLSFRLLRWWKS